MWREPWLGCALDSKMTAYAPNSSLYTSDHCSILEVNKEQQKGSKVQAAVSHTGWENKNDSKGKKKNTTVNQDEFINMLWQDQQLCRLYEDLHVLGDNSSTHIVF